jgi:plasmid stability protein
MAALTIRGLPDPVRAKLRLRAARAGRSMEAEVRAILTAACQDQEPRASAEELRKWVDKLYGRRRPRRVAARLLAQRRRESARE